MDLTKTQKQLLHKEVFPTRYLPGRYKITTKIHQIMGFVTLRATEIDLHINIYINISGFGIVSLC